MPRITLVGLIGPMTNRAGANSLALSIQKQASDDRPHALKIPAPQGGILTNGERPPPFQAEPTYNHRNRSQDSRVVGPVASRFVSGRAVFAHWPVDPFGSLSAMRTTEANTK
jgi:hypothetical protein